MCRVPRFVVAPLDDKTWSTRGRKCAHMLHWLLCGWNGSCCAFKFARHIYFGSIPAWRHQCERTVHCLNNGDAILYCSIPKEVAASRYTLLLSQTSLSLLSLPNKPNLRTQIAQNWRAHERSSRYSHRVRQRPSHDLFHFLAWRRSK